MVKQKKSFCNTAKGIITMITVSVLVSACSSDSSVNTAETEAEVIDEYVHCWDYNDDYAWVFYNGDANYYIAVIDREGNMTYKYDSGLSESEVDNLFSAASISRRDSMFICQDGYAYIDSIHNNEKLTVLSPSGTAVEYESDSEGKILSYGNGYVITRTEYATFDSSGYVYTLFDNEGEIIDQAKSSEKIEEGAVYYCGNDIFCIRTYTNSEYLYRFYNAANGNELESVSVEYEEYGYTGTSIGSFIDDETTMYLELDDMKYEGEQLDSCDLAFMDADGNIIKINSDYAVSDKYFTPVVSDNKCFYFGLDSSGDIHYMVCDLETETVSELYPAHEDMIDLTYLEINQSSLKFQSGNLVIPLQGKDGKSYIEVIDENGSLLLEPVRADDYDGFADDRLVVSSDNECNVYDSSLNLVYSLGDTEFDTIREYSDNAAYVRNYEEGTMPAYFDLNGNLLFEEVSTANIEEMDAITITVSEIDVDDAAEYAGSEAKAVSE